ncbi:MAG: ABC transporter ATP-binding protein [Caldivirga sp.]|jgi:oligopeptide/dipeptide ABC transporter ATP-binding protein
MSKELIKLMNVYVSFRIGGLFTKITVNVLRNINLTIYDGETFGLVGESGCGKTTLGKVIAGLIKPTSGKILYKGKDISAMTKDEFLTFRREVQYLHQDPFSSLNPVQTVYTILSRPLIKHKIVDPSNVEEEVMELLRMVGLTPPSDFMYRYPHQLSGGQRQRVALARIMSVRPKVLIADEPVSMIDVSQRIGILRLLLDLRKETNMTIIYITHDLATLRYISREGRVAVMYLGGIVELTDVERLLTKPLHPYTQILLSALLEPDPNITRNKKVNLRSMDIPSIVNLPPGCKFHTRCPYAINGICDVKEPDLVEVETNHYVACHLAKGDLK